MDFARARVAVLVDGCFSHSFPQNGSRPKGNRDCWTAKFTPDSAGYERHFAELTAVRWARRNVREINEPVECAAVIAATVGFQGARLGQ